MALAEANASNRVFLESDVKAMGTASSWLPAWEPEQVTCARRCPGQSGAMNRLQRVP